MSSTMTWTILTGGRSTEGSIKNWVNNSLVPSSAILAEAEAEIYNRLRVREMLTLKEGTLGSGSYRIALPTGYRAMYSFRFTGTKKATLTKIPLYELEENFEYDADSNRATGKPETYAADGSYIWFDKKANEAYPYTYRYYQALPNLAEATNEGNFLTDKFPTLLRCACMYKAFQWLRNTREEMKYLREMEREIEQVNEMDDFEQLGSDLVMTVE